MKDLKQISVIGMGLLGGSVVLSILQSQPGVKVVGFSHRASTRDKAQKIAGQCQMFDDLKASVQDADMVILSTPISTFEEIFKEIKGELKPGCIVTDVGSTKAQPSKWAAKTLGSDVHYVGSHPIAGSEQRGVEFSRDDLFNGALCIVTVEKRTNPDAMETVKQFWGLLGCRVKVMKPAQHDKIFGYVSHLPHLTAAALVNTNNSTDLKFAGKGLIDTTRIASGPANIWVDVFLSNSGNINKGISSLIAELEKFKDAIGRRDGKEIERLLEKARKKRAGLIDYKLSRKELL